MHELDQRAKLLADFLKGCNPILFSFMYDWRRRMLWCILKNREARPPPILILRYIPRGKHTAQQRSPALLTYLCRSMVSIKKNKSRRRYSPSGPQRFTERSKPFFTPRHKQLFSLHKLVDFPSICSCSFAGTKWICLICSYSPSRTK